MIYVNIRGNLGNQLFTYAFARKLQEFSKQKICLNYYYLKKNKPEYTFSLDKYKLNDNVIFECDKPLPWFVNPYSIFARTVRKIFPNIYFQVMSKFGCYLWAKKDYKKVKFTKHKNYYVDGYWQSDKYFNDIRNIICQEIQPKELPNKENENLYNLIKNTESVCITIRRGDYVSNPEYKKKFYICDEKYFYKGLEELKKYVPNLTLFIFSDDIEWAKKNLNFGQKMYYETGKDGVCEKIRLMSACKHFIISNSTFSWWAQYLCENDEKIVIAPSIWYTNGEKGDIYQEKWKLI